MQRRRSQHRLPLSGALAVLVVFAKIGSTAFGGGSATIAAMRQACIRPFWSSYSKAYAADCYTCRAFAR